jgi:hypothetical protein
MGMKSADREDGDLRTQGRVKAPTRDCRLAQNRNKPTGQDRVKREDRDRRLATNLQGNAIRSERTSTATVQA